MNGKFDSVRMIRSIHVRMARAALNWTLRDLEKRAGVNKNTISRYEAGRDVMSSTLDSLEKAFTDEGVIFIVGEGSLGPGVRLTQKAYVGVLGRRKRAAQSAKRRTKPKRRVRRVG